MIAMHTYRFPLTSLTLLVILAVEVPRSHAREPKKPLAIDDALSLRSFVDLTPISLSPDGKWLAYSVRHSERTVKEYRKLVSGVPPWARNADIFLSNAATGEVRNLTAGSADNWFPTWSPDGHSLAFLSDRDDSCVAHLWVWNAAKNELKRLSEIDIRTDQIEWTPDSQKILVLTAAATPKIKDYGAYDAQSESEKGPTGKEGSDTTVILYQASAASTADYGVSPSDPWSLDGKLRNLTLIDVRTGRGKTIAQDTRIAAYSLSPDGAQIAYTIPERFEKPGSQQILYTLAVIGITAERYHVVASTIRLGFDGASFSWSPDGSEIAFQAGGMEEATHDCFVVDVGNSRLQNVSLLSPAKKSTRSDTAQPLWDPTGQYVYFVQDGIVRKASRNNEKTPRAFPIADREVVRLIPTSRNLLWTSDGGRSTVVVTHDEVGKQDGFYRIDFENAENKALQEQGQCYTCTNALQQFVVAGGRVAFFAEDARHDADVWISCLNLANPRRLTHLNPQFDQYRLGSARLIDWLSSDGERLHGALLLPADYEEGKRYPLIVWVYGGLSLSDNWDHFGLAGAGPFNLQLLATRGYAVLLPDAPQHLGTPMADLGKDVLPGLNKVIEMGVADPNQMGVMGHSYGGYSALSLLVQTNRFKAAVEVDGFADLVSYYGEMDGSGNAFGSSIAEGGQGLMGSQPWQLSSRFVENSPIFYLDRVITPLLVVHGTHDTTVAPFLADQIFVGLRRLGKEAEYAKYEGEGHSPSYWSYENQVDFCNRFIQWFDDHLKPRVSDDAHKHAGNL